MTFSLNLSKNLFNDLHSMFCINDPVEKTYPAPKKFLNKTIHFL